DTYYNLYLMYMRNGRQAEAEKYRQLILTDFADSKYGIAMRDPDYIENLRTMDARQQQIYEQTYEAYMDNRNSDVHTAVAQMQEQYPLSKIMPKFMFLDALAYVTERKPEEFNSVLRDLLERYPDTDITPVAAAWLKGMAQGRELQAGEKNLRGMIWDLKLSNDTTDVGGNNAPAEFEINPDSRQLLVFTFPTDRVSSNALLYEIARHNFRSFVVKDFDLEPMNFGRLGMIIVRGFDNQSELNHYRSVMAASPDITLPAGVRPIAISEDNFRLLIEEGRSFEEYFRYLDEVNYIDAQEHILDPEDIEELPAEEAPAEEAHVEEPEAREPADMPAPAAPTPAVTPTAPTPDPAPAVTPAAQNTAPMIHCQLYTYDAAHELTRVDRGGRPI
ncbi:MAG: hypothetical protein K2I04_01135, partial [Muribaculaceae bacterium]|nr:hypothetical protein [Muribaculaceae bacterium]